MIKGTILWNERSTFSIQTNNAIETILSKKLPKDSRGVPVGWLEDCGPTAAVNCLDAMGRLTIIRALGGWSPQPEDILALWFNDPGNYRLMRAARPDIDPKDYLGNEVPQYYPPAIVATFGHGCEYVEGKKFADIAAILQSGKAVMICLKNPGHYLACVAFDDSKNQIVYRDSWPGRTGTSGFNLYMDEKEFLSNVKPFAIVFK